MGAGNSGICLLLAITLAIRAQMARPATGREGLIGEIGRARSRLAPEGKVFLHGELWDAYCDSPVEEGEKIRVLQVDGLKLKVGKKRRGGDEGELEERGRNVRLHPGPDRFFPPERHLPSPFHPG